jgi:hypothetical protein
VGLAGFVWINVSIIDTVMYHNHLNGMFFQNNDLSQTLLKAKQERLDNWRTLQELAGIIL